MGAAGPTHKPALLTGTSTEFLGSRPLPKVLQRRPVVFLFGPKGSGKTEVAMRLARSNNVYWSSRAIERAVLSRVRDGVWPPEALDASCLVLDGPVFVRTRAALHQLLQELLRLRIDAGERTIVTDAARDGSAEKLLDGMAAGDTVIIGLRFPKGRRGRLRYARRICEEQGLPKAAAAGTERLEPWTYQAVSDALLRWVEDVESEERLLGENEDLGKVDPAL